jgi:hypothetical protein
VVPNEISLFRSWSHFCWFSGYKDLAPTEPFSACAPGDNGDRKSDRTEFRPSNPQPRGTPAGELQAALPGLRAEIARYAALLLHKKGLARKVISREPARRKRKQRSYTNLSMELLNAASRHR